MLARDGIQGVQYSGPILHKTSQVLASMIPLNGNSEALPNYLEGAKECVNY